MTDKIPPHLEPLVTAKLENLLARDAAMERLQEQRAAGLAIPPPVRLSDLLAMPQPDVKHRIKGLMKIRDRALLAAQQKAGKTTLRNNMVGNLVDGDDFLGVFPVTAVAPDRTVFVIDLEMDEWTSAQWLRDLSIQHPERVVLHSLRGRASTFGIHVPAVRREFAKIMNDCGAEVAVLDCVRPVLDAHGLSEDKDCGRFLEAWDELMSEAGVSESIVIHHMGHQNERARGDSRLLDWPDVNWRLLKANQAGQPKSVDPFDPPAGDYGGVRVFTAHGRDVDVPRGALDFDPATRRYKYRISAPPTWPPTRGGSGRSWSLSLGSASTRPSGG